MKVKKYMNRLRSDRVIISGGGTGGHIFPAISIANALKNINQGMEILFVGAEGRMEMEKVPAAGYNIVGLPVSGFNRRNLFGNIKVLIRLLKSLRIADRILRDFRPGAVIGVGGYASGPVLRQAGRMGIPTLIQEQNSYAGITNKLLAKKAARICVAWDGMEKYFPSEKIIKTGNPVRQDFDKLDDLRNEALNFFKLSNEKPVVLVLGGSLGAATINRSISDDLEKVRNSGLQWIWQTGSLYFEDVNALVSVSSSDNIKVFSFINRMDYAFAAADVIISRAGAGTISELCLVGKPVILVPSPNVAEDHPAKNALSLADKGAAVIVADSQAPVKLIDETVRLVNNGQLKRSLSENIKKMAVKDAALRIAMEVLNLLNK
jgi:UDP-N-acetylglucosamine--N-acetylmuramyl-(pentapeptide) pyrophosphoryl-undecaprenol N-acetylglucosamine transferase